MTTNWDRQQIDTFLASLVLIGFSYLMLSIATPMKGDFSLFRKASLAFVNGENPYQSFEHGNGESTYPLPYTPGIYWLTAITTIPNETTAKSIWDFVSYYSFGVSILLWFELLWKRWPNIHEYVGFFIASFSCGVIWNLWFHHPTLLIFFFTTLSIWLIHHKKPFWSGLSTGLMLLKPHLTWTVAYFIFLKSDKKPYLLGIGLSLFLPFIFFISYIRPVSGLSEWARSLHLHESPLLTKTNQGIVPNIYQTIIGEKNREILYSKFKEKRVYPPTQSADHTLIPFSSELRFMMRLVFGIYVAFSLALIFYLRNTQNINLLLSLSLTGNLLTSIYSQSYDGVFTVPLLLISLQSLYAFFAPIKIAVGLFFINILFAYYLLFGIPLGTDMNWRGASFSSILYALMSLATYIFCKKIKLQEVVYETV